MLKEVRRQAKRQADILAPGSALFENTVWKVNVRQAVCEAPSARGLPRHIWRSECSSTDSGPRTVMTHLLVATQVLFSNEMLRSMQHTLKEPGTRARVVDQVLRLAEGNW